MSSSDSNRDLSQAKRQGAQDEAHSSPVERLSMEDDIDIEFEPVQLELRVPDLREAATHLLA